MQFRKVFAHTYGTKSQAQSIQLALEDSRKKVEEQLAQTQKKFEATTALNKWLYDQLQAETNALEELGNLAVMDTRQRMSALQVNSIPHTIDIPSVRLSSHIIMWPCTRPDGLLNGSLCRSVHCHC